MATIAERIEARADDPNVAWRFEDESWTWSEYVRACAERAALARELRRDGPFHIGVLLENVPEFSMWLGAAAVNRAVIVGINPTRRGAELARDITHTECQLIVTESKHRHLLDGLELGIGPERILYTDEPEYADSLARHEGAALPDIALVQESDLFLLLFTSGTSGAPKACLCSQGRLDRMSNGLMMLQGLTSDDVLYQAMPLFHSNALITGWAPTIITGGTGVLRRRFSASGFLPDVRKYGVTYFNYVGKPLSYILATPEQPDDADTTLTKVFGNEAADLDIQRFQERFGVPVVDGYGSTEGGATITRTEDMPAGALGRAAEGTEILDPETGERCPPARFDEHGVLVNPDEAIGEIVNRLGVAGFEGYWKNDEANRSRTRDGIYWTGDLGYQDEDGYFYFAGRDYDWLRVDGENFAAAPIERILARHPSVVLASVYAVPDEKVGDQVMAALQLRPGAAFDPDDFQRFLDAQEDLGTKWAPRYVRVTEQLPVTETSKVLKRLLRAEGWECADEVWWKPDKTAGYERLTKSG